MFKSVFALVMLMVPTLSWAALDEAETLKALAGRYQVSLSRGQNVEFTMRENGQIAIKAEGAFEYATIAMTVTYSKSVEGLNGLPVAHVVIGNGSDEDMQDIHLLMAVIQDGQTLRPRVISTFTTFNDGPNDVTDVSAETFTVSRYDARAKRFVKLD